MAGLRCAQLGGGSVSKGVSRTGALTATCQIRSARLVVSRVAMAGSFWVTSAARAQIDFAQTIAPVVGGIWGQPLAALPNPASGQAPHRCTPVLCGAAPVGAVIVITPSARYLTPRHVMAAKQRTCLAEHDIGPTNDTRRGVRPAVPERRLLVASVVWEQSLDKRPLAFWCSGALGQWVMSWGQG